MKKEMWFEEHNNRLPWNEESKVDRRIAVESKQAKRIDGHGLIFLPQVLK